MIILSTRTSATRCSSSVSEDELKECAQGCPDGRPKSTDKIGGNAFPALVLTVLCALVAWSLRPRNPAL